VSSLVPSADSRKARGTLSRRGMRRDFGWRVPEFYNIAFDACDKWSREPDRLALIHERKDGSIHRYTFGEVRSASDRAANLFRVRGLGVGDRVAILLGQEPETAIAHLAAYKIGAIAVPLFTLFGVDALHYRLSDSGARLVVTDSAGAAKLAEIRRDLPMLESILCIDGRPPGTDDFHEAVSASSEEFVPVRTRADDPALIIYTSGTTGPPKGALHAHRVLLGHLPGVDISHNLLGEPGDLLWTPADWAWIGGLLDVLFPAWYHGLPVVARRFEKFTAEAALDLMQRHRVRNTFLPPTALKMLRGVGDIARRWKLDLRSVASGGETLGAELLDWGHDAFGLSINEFYGQTECNMVLSSCEALFDAKPGAIGRAVPGHDVRLIDDEGRVVPHGELGNIAIRRPDPVMFLEYWRKPEATAEKFIGEWLITGDLGRMDGDGFVTFVGRNDDVITSAGYRIGPGPIEDCLLSHPAVRMAAVVGVPDPERTEIVKAYVVLKEGHKPSDELTRELQDHVRRRLAAHEYPRQVRYIATLPLTTTGKVIRRQLRDRND
jgi:acetyl-CoA synthetase